MHHTESVGDEIDQWTVSVRPAASSTGWYADIVCLRGGDVALSASVLLYEPAFPGQRAERAVHAIVEALKGV